MASSARKSYRNRIGNSSFEDRLSGWGSSGAKVVTAEEGHLVHTGTQAIALQATNAFITQTVPAGKGARLGFSAHLRSWHDRENSPVVIRLRWVDATGSYIGAALELFIPQKQLSRSAWTYIDDCTNVAPAGTAGLNVRIEAPYAGDEAGIVVDDVAVR